jgi:mono/diheme cytochrome c family protein
MIRIGFLVGMIGLVGTGSVSGQTAIQRGEYLVNGVMACGNCHTPPSPTGPVMEKFLAGGLTFDTPGFKVTASNITPDRDTGIGTWTAEDIKRSIVEGKRPNGVNLAMMPVEFFKVLTASDVAAIVAYVQSVKPINNKVPDPEYRRPIHHDVYSPATSQFSDADMQDKVKRGLYLATIGHCMECHTPRIDGKQDFTNDLGKGGREFPGPWGKSISPNITPSNSAGLGRWSDDEIKRAITQGIKKDGSRLKPPMGYGYYAKMNAEDLDAVVAWLRSIPVKD